LESGFKKGEKKKKKPKRLARQSFSVETLREKGTGKGGGEQGERGNHFGRGEWWGRKSAFSLGKMLLRWE